MRKTMKNTGDIHTRIIVTKGETARELVLTTSPESFDLHTREGRVNPNTNRVTYRYWHHQICYDIRTEFDGETAHDIAERRVTDIVAGYRDAGYEITVLTR